jgi:hypothetical protein
VNARAHLADSSLARLEVSDGPSRVVVSQDARPDAALGWWTRVPSWLWMPLAIFALARTVSAVFLISASRGQEATATLARGGDALAGYFVYAPKPADPGYLGMVTNWDGQWYQWIATAGYLTPEVDASPEAAWAWAFPPGYPATVRAVMEVTGWSFPAAAAVTSTTLGAIAMVLLFRLLEGSGGRWVAVVGVSATSFFVSAPLLQVAYSESLALLLLVGVLLLLRRRRWLGAAVVVLLLSTVRLISPPLALVGLAVLWHDIRRSGRRTPAELIRAGVFVLTCAAGPFLWSKVASRLLDVSVSGASRADDQFSRFTLGWFGTFAGALPVALAVPILAALAGIVVLLARIASGPGAAAWGPEVRAWCWAYPLYVLAVTPPTTGFIRYLLLAFPLALPLAGGPGGDPRRCAPGARRGPGPVGPRSVRGGRADPDAVTVRSGSAAGCRGPGRPVPTRRGASRRRWARRCAPERPGIPARRRRHATAATRR